jgi:hypothetical protein
MDVKSPAHQEAVRAILKLREPGEIPEVLKHKKKSKENSLRAEKSLRLLIANKIMMPWYLISRNLSSSYSASIQSTIILS